MKKYLHACFLAFLCLYRSKFTGLRRSCTDHPRRVRGKDSHPSPGLKEYPKPVLTWLYHFLFGNLESKEPGCADNNRFKAVVFLGANHPKTLNRLLNLASFVLFIRCLTIKVFTLYKGLLTRSQSSAFKKVQSPKPYLRDASRGMCLPSYGMPRKLMVVALLSLPLAGIAQERKERAAPVVIYGEIHSPFEYAKLEAILFENFLWHNPSKLDHIQDSIILKKPTMLQKNPRSTYFRWVSAPISEPAYLTLKTESHFLFKDFMVSPGDSVMVFFDDFTKNTYFHGKSALPYELQNELVHQDQAAQFQTGLVINNPNPDEFLSNGFSRLLEEFGSAYGRSFKVIPYDPYYDLKSLRKKINALDLPFSIDSDKNLSGIEKEKLDIIKVNQLGSQLYTIYNLFRFAYSREAKQSDGIMKDSLSTFYKNSLPSPKKFITDPQLIYHSSQMHIAIIEYANIAMRLDGVKVTDWIKDNFEGAARDKLLGYYLLNHAPNIADPENQIAEILPEVRTPWIKDMLQKYISGYQESGIIGAYEFEDSQHNTKALSDIHQGKILLLDFWFTGCGACVIFYRDILAKLEEEYGSDGNIVFVSISTDKDKTLWKKSLESGKYSSEDAVNLYAGPDHDILKNFQISAFPRQIMLGPNMKILQSGGFPLTLNEWRLLVQSHLDTVNNN